MRLTENYGGGRENDDPNAWRTVYDEMNDDRVQLTPKECDIIRR